MWCLDPLSGLHSVESSNVCVRHLTASGCDVAHVLSIELLGRRRSRPSAYTVYCVLCTVYCGLWTVDCVLCTVSCVLCPVYCVLCTVCCVLFAVCCRDFWVILRGLVESEKNGEDFSQLVSKPLYDLPSQLFTHSHHTYRHSLFLR
jgi:hypothetical protein